MSNSKKVDMRTAAMTLARHTAMTVALVGLSSLTTAQVEAWAARYDGPGNGREVVTDLAVDIAGNVYVTCASDGTSTGLDYATIKYDRDGNQLWVARFDGASRNDGAAALAVDALGNVHVTGTSTVWWGDDYATIKYDSGGSELWVARYGGQGNSCWARDIALDATGAVYVAGGSAVGPFQDYATVKYDSNGNLLWVARYDGPGRGYDDPAAVAVDAAGNILVTGQSDGGAGLWPDYATIKYDSNGNQLWVARYDGPGNSSDFARALALDASGNVYVAGGSGLDFATVKYGPDGNLVWVARYDGPAHGWDEARALDLDVSGNVYVTGPSEGALAPQEIDYATVKYDSNGNQLWVARYNDPGNVFDLPEALVVDPGGGVIVTGQSGDEVGAEGVYATVKYDSSGSVEWIARYKGTGSASGAKATAVGVDGCVYVAGESEGLGGVRDCVTIKYSTFGFQAYGPGTSGSGGLEPQLAATGSATLGSSFSFDITNGLGGATGGMLAGAGFSSQVALPVLGGIVLVQPSLSFPIVLGGAAGVHGTGNLTMLFQVPNVPAVVGVNLNFQGVFVDPGALQGISMTNGVAMWIG